MPVCVRAPFFLLLLLFFSVSLRKYSIFFGFDDGISSIVQTHWALLWFMTYLFSFCSAYISFGTFHFSRCQEKKNNKMREPLALSVTLFIIWQIKVFCACVFVDNWFFWRTFCTKLPIHTYAEHLFFFCCWKEKDQQKMVLSIYFTISNGYKNKCEKRKLLHKHSCCLELKRYVNIWLLSINFKTFLDFEHQNKIPNFLFTFWL